MRTVFKKHIYRKNGSFFASSIRKLTLKKSVAKFGFNYDFRES